MFEQYLTMVINPDINGFMIANMTNPQYSQARHDTKIQDQGVELFLYFNPPLQVH